AGDSRAPFGTLDAHSPPLIVSSSHCLHPAPQTHHASRIILCLLLLTASVPAQQPPADTWLTNRYSFPATVKSVQTNEARFADLRTEVLAGRAKVLVAGTISSNAAVELWWSTDEPGHWAARDWNLNAMERRGNSWESPVPVDHPDVPIVYFARARIGKSAELSPMRVFHPRRAGMEEPTRIFWAFLEGFEEGTDSWTPLVDPSEAKPLETGRPSKNGKAALSLHIPQNKRSVSVGTTRLRSWHFQQGTATGVRFWARTRAGTGKARFTLQANAFTPEQKIAVCPLDTDLNDAWKRVELPFTLFPRLPLNELDYFTIEFIAPGPAELLIDDLELIGPWNFDLNRAP
ncbi:MAG: hypothetical protein AB1705_21915, partial [Verrucomicrobiota bacterium]